MEAQKVHEYTVETGENGMPVARLGRVHNLIMITREKEDYFYYDGKFVLKNGLPDVRDIPEEVVAQAHAIPFEANHNFNADVIMTCEFCTWAEPSRHYAKHLADTHIRPTAGPGPGFGKPNMVEALMAQPKVRPEDLPEPAGNGYVVDDEGFVVLKTDGAPKLKAGRRRNDA